MMFDSGRFTTHRRGFLGRLAAGAAAFGLGGLAAPVAAAARPTKTHDHVSADPEFEAWLNKITGKHKMLFDAPAPNQGFGLAWARVFLNTTNDTYGTTDADNSVVIVLRHGAIPLGMEGGMWAKYKFGEFFKVNDGATNAPALRNPFTHAKPGELPLPGMAIDELVAKGVQFGICNVALTVYSGIFAKSMGLQADAIKRDWVANLLPGIEVVPSGVIAVNGAQERGCAYCFAG
jgi:intracellular sulfur oxidation DsrE/DsrF family protein